MIAYSITIEDDHLRCELCEGTAPLATQHRAGDVLAEMDRFVAAHRHDDCGCYGNGRIMSIGTDGEAEWEACSCAAVRS